MYACTLESSSSDAVPTAALYPWLPVEATPRRAIGLGFRANVSEIIHTPLEDVGPAKSCLGCRWQHGKASLSSPIHSMAKAWTSNEYILRELSHTKFIPALLGLCPISPQSVGLS